MTRHVKNYGPWDPVYIFVGDDGENVHVDSKALYEWAQSAGLEVFDVPVEEQAARDMVRDQAIDWKRLDEMQAKKAQFRDPIIFLKSDTETDGAPDVYLCDGHHRYFRAWTDGEPLIPAYVLEYDQWQEFRIEGFPTITQDKLRTMAVRPPRT